MSTPQFEDIKDVVRVLQAEPAWRWFREKIIQRRLDELSAGWMRPAKGVEEVLQAEREKGAAIALRGLLVLFDVEMPTKKESEDASATVD